MEEEEKGLRKKRRDFANKKMFGYPANSTKMFVLIASQHFDIQ